MEPLEDRRLLAVGDLLQTLADAGTATVQPATAFGSAVATDGNLPVVGAPSTDVDGESDLGLAYVFRSSTGELLATLASPTGRDYFGTALTISGKTVVVGSNCSDEVYVFDASTGDLVSTLTDPTGTGGGRFGSSVAIEGSNVLVGARSDDTDATNGGAVYVFDSDTATLFYTLTPPVAAVSGDFGNSIAISDGVAVVGAPRDDTTMLDGGSVYLFDANRAPTAIALDNATVAENAATSTVVGTLSTTDPDAGDTFTYTLVDSADGRFALDGDRLLVADGTLLDYEMVGSHAITVRTTDADGLSYQQDFTITVTDVNETPTDITLSATSLAENQPRGTVVGILDSVDPDMPVLGGSAFRYELVDGDGAADNAQFSIELTNYYGLKTYWLVSNATFDYETQSSYNVRIRTTDLGGLSYEEAFTITVTDLHDFDSVAVYDPSSSTFRLRGDNVSGAADYTFAFGVAGAGWQTLVGDWDGNGTSDVGLYDAATSTFCLTTAYADGVAEYSFGFGMPDAGWIPLVGDWNGDGMSGVGLYDPATSTFYLTDTLAAGTAEYTFGYGVPEGGWTPLVGDWNGNGASGVGLYDPHASCFYLTDTLATGVAEYTFGYGVPDAGWTPLVGDWNGNGATGVGLYDPQGSSFYLTDTLATGYAETTFAYGVPEGGWTPLVGDWDGNGASGVGLYDAAGATFYLSNALTTGVAEATVQIAEATAGCVPLVGCWTEKLPATAVDQVDLADVAAQELDVPLTSNLDNAAAIDLALATL